MAFVSAAEYKTSRKIAGSDFDTEITAFIAAAQEIAERWCDYSAGGFEQDERTYSLDGTGHQELILPDAPIDTGSTVTVLKVADDGTTSTVSSSDYRVLGSRGVIARLAYDPERGRFDGPVGWGFSPVWAPGYENYRVTCTTGWASGSRPEGLMEAIYRLVDTLGAERGSSAYRAAVASGSENQTERTPMDRAAIKAELLGPYRRSRV